MTFYRKFSDGWFTYYFCAACGHKELRVPEICPKCKRKIDFIRSE